MNQNDQKNTQQPIYINQSSPSQALPQLQPYIIYPNQPQIIDSNQQLISGQLQQSHHVMMPHYQNLLPQQFQQSQNVLYSQMMPYRNHTQQYANQPHNQLNLSMSPNHQYRDSSSYQQFISSGGVSIGGISPVQKQIGSNEASPINSIVNKDAQQCFSNMINNPNKIKGGLNRSKYGLNSSESIKSSPQPIHKSKVSGVKVDDSQCYEFKSDKSDPVKSLKALNQNALIDPNPINSEYMRSDHKPPSQIEEEVKQPCQIVQSSAFNNIKSSKSNSEDGYMLQKQVSKASEISQGTPIFFFDPNQNSQSQLNDVQLLNNNSLNFQNVIHQRQIIMNHQNMNQMGLALNQNQMPFIQENQMSESHSPIRSGSHSPLRSNLAPNNDDEFDWDEEMNDAVEVGQIKQHDRYLQNVILSKFSSRDQKGCLVGDFNNFQFDDTVNKAYIDSYNHQEYRRYYGISSLQNIDSIDMNQQKNLQDAYKEQEAEQGKNKNLKMIISKIQDADKEVDKVDIKKRTFQTDMSREMRSYDISASSIRIQESNHALPFIGIGSSLVDQSISVSQIQDDDQANQINSSGINPGGQQLVLSQNISQIKSSQDMGSSLIVPNRFDSVLPRFDSSQASPKKINKSQILNYNQMSVDVQQAQLVQQQIQQNQRQIQPRQIIPERLVSIEEQKVSNEYSVSNDINQSHRNSFSPHQPAGEENIAEIQQSQEESKIELARQDNHSESESRRFLESPKSLKSSSINQNMLNNVSIRSNRSNIRSQNINLVRNNNDNDIRQTGDITDRNSIFASQGQSQLSDSRDQEYDYRLDIQSQNAMSLSAKSSNSSDNSYNSSFMHAASSYAMSSNRSRDDKPIGGAVKSQFYPEHGQIVEESKEEESKNEQSMQSDLKFKSKGGPTSKETSKEMTYQSRQKQKQLQQISSSGSRQSLKIVSKRVIGKQKISSDTLEEQQEEHSVESPLLFNDCPQPPLLKKTISRNQRRYAKMQARKEKKMKKYRKKIKKMFKDSLIVKQKGNRKQLRSNSMDVVLEQNISSPSMQFNELDQQQNAQYQQELLNDIQVTVQHGGDNVLQRFNSFGESTPENSSGHDKSPKRIIETGNAVYFQNLVDRGCESKHSNLLTSTIGSDNVANHEKKQNQPQNNDQPDNQPVNDQSQPQDQDFQESSLILPKKPQEDPKEENSEEPESRHKHISFSQTAMKVGKKKILESPVNHSIIVRQIIDMLQSLMIAFNEGRIIQMTLEEKLKLKEKIEKFIKCRNDEHKGLDFVKKHLHKAFCFNSLDNAEMYIQNQDAGQQRKQVLNDKAKVDPDILIQQMRSNYYRDRAIQNKHHSNIFNSNNRDIETEKSADKGKMNAIEKDYDFYFRHYHNFFVVQSQIRHQQLIRMKKNLNLSVAMQSMQQFEETKKELFQEDINYNQKTLCFDIENVFVKLMDINDIEQFNQLREASDTNFYDYILINKKNCDNQVDELSNLEPIYKPQRYLDKSKSQLLQIIHNYDEIKFEDRSPMPLSVGSTSPPDGENKQSAPCCQLNGLGKLCLCNKFLFHVRPYTYEFLRALQPFFEIVATSNISYYLLEQIIDHMEFVLNKPITDMIIKQTENNRNSRPDEGSNHMDNSPRSEADGSPCTNQKRFISKIKKKRRQKKIEPKIFFQLLISNINYYKIDSLDHDNRSISESMENLFILTQNRKPENIFLISSNQFKLVAVMDLGFCAIPIIKYQMVYMLDDFQLNLLENYLHKLKYSKDIKYKNHNDFGYLSQILSQNKRQEDSQLSKILKSNQGSQFSGNVRLAKNIRSNISQNLSNNEMMQMCSQNISFGDGMISASDASESQDESEQIVEGPNVRRSKILNKNSIEKKFKMKSSLIDSDDDKSSSSISSSNSEEENSDEEEKFQDLQSSNCSDVFDNIMNEIEQKDVSRSRQIINNQLKQLADQFVECSPVNEEADESSSSNICKSKKNSENSIHASAVASGFFGDKRRSNSLQEQEIFDKSQRSNKSQSHMSGSILYNKSDK